MPSDQIYWALTQTTSHTIYVNLTVLFFKVGYIPRQVVQVTNPFNCQVAPFNASKTLPVSAAMSTGTGFAAASKNMQKVNDGYVGSATIAAAVAGRSVAVSISTVPDIVPQRTPFFRNAKPARCKDRRCTENFRSVLGHDNHWN
eukprot:m.291040 g.291040  ORF g.291040 m.291040 type:complete len:144 (+) comp16381_c0_seq4:2223-2654(+)